MKWAEVGYETTESKKIGGDWIGIRQVSLLEWRNQKLNPFFEFFKMPLVRKCRWRKSQWNSDAFSKDDNKKIKKKRNDKKGDKLEKYRKVKEKTRNGIWKGERK